MDLHILSLQEAIGFQPIEPTYAIRIFSSWAKDKPELTASRLYKRIAEYTFDDNDDHYQAGPLTITADVANLLVEDFAKYQRKVKALLVHCTHGRNRSPAVAIALNNLKIKTIRKYNSKRKIHRILIYGKENLKIFSDKIGFLHPEKDKKLKEVLKDFIVYEWNFPKKDKENKEFILNLLKEKVRIKKPYIVRIISKEERNLITLQDLIRKFYTIYCSVNKYINGLGTIYFELSIGRKEEVRKLVNLGVIPNLFKEN